VHEIGVYTTLKRPVPPFAELPTQLACLHPSWAFPSLTQHWDAEKPAALFVSVAVFARASAFVHPGLSLNRGGFVADDVVARVSAATAARAHLMSIASASLVLSLSV
jgi:hypothetical protein